MQIVINNNEFKKFIKNLIWVSKLKCFLDDSNDVILKLIPKFFVLICFSKYFVCLCFINVEHNYKLYKCKINFKNLFNLFKNLPDLLSVNIIFNKNYINIISGNVKSIIPIKNCNNISISDNKDFISKIEIFSIIFKNLINAVKFSIGINDVRIFLNGIFIFMENNCLKLITSNGQVLSFKIFYFSKLINEFFKIIIPRETIFELLRILDSSNKTIIFVYKSKVKIQIGNYIIVSKIINDTFPDFEILLKNNYVLFFNILKIDLINICQRVSIFSNNSNNSIKFKICNENLILSAQLLTGEKIIDSIIIKCSKNNCNLSFMLDYISLLNILNNIDVLKIKINIDMECNRILITDILNTDFFYILTMIIEK